MELASKPPLIVANPMLAYGHSPDRLPLAGEFEYSHVEQRPDDLCLFTTLY
ncbi:hypothetical protein [Aidingimonas halophila]|uniref:hypothetical protein n=1 Tax=Aidingimonas halophila TaxID=574349 RepID=UPI001E3AF001|nr:hypothetical protein [Aidingimonas halophila]